MTSARDLLYREAGPFERALAAALSDTLDVPIAELLDPARTRADFLPFLSAHESADLWFDDWPLARRRLMVAAARAGIARLKGTRGALPAFLPFVDAELLDRRAYPSPFVAGHSFAGVDPIGHQPFTTHILVRVPLHAPAGGFVVGKAAIGEAALLTFDREPLRRVRRAVEVAKGEDTLITINHAHRRPVTMGDGFPLDGSFRFGDLTDRKRL